MGVRSVSSPLWKSICTLKNQLVEQCGGIPAAITTLENWHSGSGRFLVHAHDFFRIKGESVQWATVVWEEWSLPRTRFILWLATLGRLRTRDRLSYLPTETVCSLCSREDETHAHLFFNCNWTSLLWNRAKSWLRIYRPMSTLSSAIRGLNGRSKELNLRMRRVSLALLVYLIWHERNNHIFAQKSSSVDATLRRFQILFYTVLLFHEKDHSLYHVAVGQRS